MKRAELEALATLIEGESNRRLASMHAKTRVGHATESRERLAILVGMDEAAELIRAQPAEDDPSPSAGTPSSPTTPSHDDDHDGGKPC